MLENERVMHMDLINHEYIDTYINQLPSFVQDAVLAEMQTVAKEQGFSVIRDGTAALITTLLTVKQPRKILEIGTSIGYSTVVMSRAVKLANIKTIEYDDDTMQKAKAFIQRAVPNHSIEFICGDAGEVLHYMDDQFDVIYLDGPKAQYISYLPDCIRLLNKDGMLLCDDVLFYGMVANDDLIIKRRRTIVKRLREFNHAICTTEQLTSTILPIGNGFSVSIRR
jgi:predicted O-methyltransferase YrrM